MDRSSKILKCGSSKIWVTGQKLFSVSLCAFVSLCETIKDNDLLGRMNGVRTFLSAQSPVSDVSTTYAYDGFGRISSVSALTINHCILLTQVKNSHGPKPSPPTTINDALAASMETYYTSLP